MEEKRQGNYMAYRWGVGDEYEKYVQRGYMYTEKKLSDEEKLYQQKIVLGENPIGETSKRYLEKIIQYCQKQDIPITLFIIPISELELISTENYDNYINQIREIIKKYDIAFYDFNLVKEEYLPIRHSVHFRDIDHLNDAGANLFTEFFNKVVSGNTLDNEKYFYDSYAEKLGDSLPAIYGLYYKDVGQERIFHIASNRKCGMEYKITLTTMGAVKTIIQDFMDNQEFTLSIEEHGICTIEVRMGDDLEIVQVMEIKY